MLPQFAYARARSVDEAVSLLAAKGARIHAGGTDLLGCLRDGVFRATKLVSISGLDELRQVTRTDDGGLRLGALLPVSSLAGSPAVVRQFPGLAQAASAVASPQLRNQGTLGGNLCQRPRCWYYRGEFHCAKKGGDLCYALDGENRYHAVFGGGSCHIVHPSDTAPMLVALGASVTIVGPAGRRSIPLSEFFVLPEENLRRENVLEPGEIVTQVFVPPQPPGSVSSYRKVRERGAWDFALASVALALEMNGRRVRAARVVLGGVAPVPWRSAAAERALAGKTLDVATARAAADAAVQGAEPLAQNGYKVPLVKGVVEESLLAI